MGGIWGSLGVCPVDCGETVAGCGEGTPETLRACKGGGGGCICFDWQDPAITHCRWKPGEREERQAWQAERNLGEGASREGADSISAGRVAISYQRVVGLFWGCTNHRGPSRW